MTLKKGSCAATLLLGVMVVLAVGIGTFLVSNLALHKVPSSKLYLLHDRNTTAALMAGITSLAAAAVVLGGGTCLACSIKEKQRPQLDLLVLEDHSIF